MARLYVVGEWHGPGEERTARHLAEHLPADWVVVANREVPRGTGSVDIDLVVVGLRRVFVLEEKSWGRRVEIRENAWIVNGEQRHSPLSQVRDASRVLAGRVERRVPGWSAAKRAMPRAQHLVNGHVVLSHPRLELVDDELPGEPLLGPDAVLRLDAAVPRLEHLDATAASTLTPELRDALLHYLLELPASGGDAWPATIHQYTVLGEPTRQDSAYLLPARNPAGQLLVLVCVPVEGGIDAQDARRLATREFAALEMLSSSGRTWRVRDWFEWDTFVVTPVLVEMDGTSLHKLAQLAVSAPEAPRPFAETDTVVDAFRALADVHQHGISHRALAPRSIEVDRSGRVRFRDFSRSRIVAEGTISSLLEDHASDAFAPRGQRLGWRDELDDVYSLALSLAVWMRADPGEDPDHDACRTWARARGDDLGAAIAAALDPDRRHRPSAARVVDLVAPAEGERYEFVERIGHGAMGEVWRARDRRLGGREVAVKCLPTGRTVDSTQTERFHKEARLLAGLRSHPHIIAVLDWDVRDDDLRLVMPHIEGIDLARLLEARRTLPLDRVLTIAEQLGQALDAAHAAGLVHRDVKPANIMLDGRYRGDFVYLIDFGIASGGTLTLEATGQILGTPYYMAPERFLGELEDERVDVYSLGCVVFELLTGAPPFTGDFRRVAAAHVNQDPPRPEGLPEPVVDVLTGALAKEAAARPASAGALVAALREAAQGAEISDATANAPATPVGIRRPAPAASATEADASRAREEAAALNALAEELDRAGRLPAAAEAFARVVTRFEAVDDAGVAAAVARAIVGRGFALAELGQWEEALETYRQAAARGTGTMDPALREQAAKALNAHGVALGVLGRPAEGLPFTQRVIDLCSASSAPAVRERAALALGNRAWLLDELGREDEAQSLRARAVEQYLDDDDPGVRVQGVRALVDRADQLARDGRHTEALDALERVVADHREAATVAERTEAADGLAKQVANAMISRGHALSHLGRHDEALASHDAVPRSFGHLTSRWMQLDVVRAQRAHAGVLIRTERAEEALEVLREVREGLEPVGSWPVREAFAALLNVEAWALAELGRRDEALAGREEVIERFGDAVESRVQLEVASARTLRGTALAAAGDRAGALACFRRVVTDTGQRSSWFHGVRAACALRWEAELLAGAGDREEAQARLATVVGRYGERSAWSLREEVARALRSQAELLEAAGRRDEALARYEEVVERFGADPVRRMRPQVAAALNARGVLLAAEGRNEDALAVYGEVVRRYVDAPSPEAVLEVSLAASWTNQGLALGRLGRDLDALLVYERVVNRFSSHQAPAMQRQFARMLRARAASESTLGRSRSAAETYLRLVSRFADASDPFLRESVGFALNCAGVLLEKLRRRDEATRCYERVVDRGTAEDPSVVRVQTATALNNLGVGVGGADPERAMERHREVVGRFGDDTDLGVRRQVVRALDCVGTLLAGQGRHDEAARAHGEVVERCEGVDDAALRAKAARAANMQGVQLSKAGRPDEVAACYQRVVDGATAGDPAELRVHTATALNNLGVVAAVADSTGASDRHEQVVRLFGDDGDTAVRREVARALDRLGTLLARQGRHDEAARAHGEIVDRYDGVDDPRLRAKAAHASNVQGVQLESAGHRDAAVACYERTVTRFEGDRSPEARLAVVTALTNVGHRSTDRSRAEAVRWYRRALDDYGADAADAVRAKAAEAGNLAGAALVALDRRDDALAVFRQVAGVCGFGDDPRCQAAVAHALNRQGLVLSDLGRVADETLCYRAVVDRFGDVADDAVRNGVAVALHNLAVTAETAADLTSALDLHRRIVLRCAGSHDRRLRRRAARALAGRARVLRRLDRPLARLGALWELVHLFGADPDPGEEVDPARRELDGRGPVAGPRGARRLGHARLRYPTPP